MLSINATHSSCASELRIVNKASPLESINILFFEEYCHAFLFQHPHILATFQGVRARRDMDLVIIRSILPCRQSSIISKAHHGS